MISDFQKEKSEKAKVVNVKNQSYKIRDKKSKEGSDEKTPTSDPRLAISWLKKIAESGGTQHIEDPLEWQRNLRKDRSLPDI